ncbi:MAG: metal ABC transporter solute-binding protein, Zn/Mn family [Moraxellaceae bacterium]
MRRLVALALLLASAPVAALEVVASIRPLALIADAVVTPGDRVQQLVPDGASGHHYALRPSDRALLARADLVFWVGPVHEHFLGKALASRPAIAAQALPGLVRRPVRRLADAQPVPETLDAHLWLEPANAIAMARALATALAARAPEKAAQYHANAEAFAARLGAATATWPVRLAALRTQPFISYHDAYHYLDAHLGLRFRGSLTHEPEHAPGARHVLAMRQRVTAENIRCLLLEPGADPALAARVFGTQPHRAVAIDEMFRAAPRGADGYVTGLSAMVDGMARCLGGA